MEPTTQGRKECEVKPEEQRIAIAEWCGAVWYRHPVSISDNRIYKFLAWPGVQEYDGQLEQWKVKSDGTERMCSMDYMAREFHIPDYLNDLNAIHEAELNLDENQARHYAHRALPMACCPEDGVALSAWGNRRAVFSTAAQRAEALLRTIGRWTDSTLHTKG